MLNLPLLALSLNNWEFHVVFMHIKFDPSTQSWGYDITTNQAAITVVTQMWLNHKPGVTMEMKCDCVKHRQWMLYWAGHLIVTSTWASCFHCEHIFKAVAHTSIFIITGKRHGLVLIYHHLLWQWYLKNMLGVQTDCLSRARSSVFFRD